MAIGVFGHTLQLLFQALQTRNSVTDTVQMTHGNMVGLVARLLGMIGQAQKFTDIIKGKAKLPAVPDKAQTIEMNRAVDPLIPVRSGRDRHNTDLFIIPDGWHLAATSAGQMANAEQILPRPHNAASFAHRSE